MTSVADLVSTSARVTSSGVFSSGRTRDPEPPSRHHCDRVAKMEKQVFCGCPRTRTLSHCLALCCGSAGTRVMVFFKGTYCSHVVL